MEKEKQLINLKEMLELLGHQEVMIVYLQDENDAGVICADHYGDFLANRHPEWATIRRYTINKRDNDILIRVYEGCQKESK